MQVFNVAPPYSQGGGGGCGSFATACSLMRARSAARAQVRALFKEGGIRARFSSP